MTSPDREEVSSDAVVKALNAGREFALAGSMLLVQYETRRKFFDEAIDIAEQQSRVIKAIRDGHHGILERELAALDALLGRG